MGYHCFGVFAAVLTAIKHLLIKNEQQKMVPLDAELIYRGVQEELVLLLKSQQNRTDRAVYLISSNTIIYF